MRTRRRDGTRPAQQQAPAAETDLTLASRHGSSSSGEARRSTSAGLSSSSTCLVEAPGRWKRKQQAERPKSAYSASARLGSRGRQAGVLPKSTSRRAGRWLTRRLLPSPRSLAGLPSSSSSGPVSSALLITQSVPALPFAQGAHQTPDVVVAFMRRGAAGRTNAALPVARC